MQPLAASDGWRLWCVALAVLSLGLLVMKTRSARLAALLMPVLMLAGIEGAARLWLLWFSTPEALALSCTLANRTYPDQAPYTGHPFLQFTGRPRRTLAGIDSLGDATFNNVGFIGKDVSREKPADVVRLAFIGGSTTATGYFQTAEERLNELAKGTGKRFESYAFALGYYTSTHSVVNFVLNVIDYQPDYVVFMHGWNDLRAAGNAEDFRGDYSHAYKAFEPPVIEDAWLIRGSVVYRWMKHRISPTPAWASLGAATERAKRPGEVRELLDRAFLRNVKTIVEVAHANAIHPVLVTQAHSTNPQIDFAKDAAGIAHFAELVRQAAGTFGDRALLVDLDRMTTGIHEEFFKDVGHHTWEGVKFTGRATAEAIYRHWSNR